jgi:pimeloyl-ACP methyl ester carboxylesterase
MSMKKTGILLVPGASLYYEVRGSGPLLLMIHGGNSDADVYSGAAEHLAGRYTVVTYDRRRLVNQDEVYRVETQIDDAYRLLTELTMEPAYVFGSSSGAIIGLDLANCHPERISILIAHEPPLTHLLSGDEKVQARQIQVNLENIGRREGVIPAIKQFASNLGMENSSNSASRPSAEKTELMIKNMNFFVMHEAPVIRNHILDLETLKAAIRTASMQILTGGGKTSRGSFPFLCAAALAEQLRVESVEFPGNHLGYVNHSKEFAERLYETLEKERPSIEE